MKSLPMKGMIILRKELFSLGLVLTFILSSCGPTPASTLPPDLTSDKRVVGYFAEWAPAGGFLVSNIDA
jgi:hypothetical protein